MVDRIGTLFGFLVGLSLILFGITWPDHLSNMYVYRITQQDAQIAQLKKQGAPRSQIDALTQKGEDFKRSWEGGITRFMDLKSILIVLGGAYAATLIAFPFRNAIKTFAYVFMVFRRERTDEEFEIVYKTMLEFSEYRFRDEIIPDARVAAIPLYFMRDAIENFIQVDWVSEDMMQEIIYSEIENYGYTEDKDIAVMGYMGKAAPAFGLLGTVVGLITLLGNAARTNATITDMIGGMSVALLTTLYGVLLSQLIFLPVAEKHQRMKLSYMRLYEMVREGCLYLHRKERPDVAEQDLQIYLSKKRRLQIRAERRAAMARGELGL
ncbi:MAG TPA: MotA/TolQ/ExbB proton channel family protein [bacterium]|nr:MotA/TolQ/ExbB proton channel family protein [bacterium]